MKTSIPVKRRSILAGAFLLLYAGLANSSTYIEFFLFEKLTRLSATGNADAQYHLGMMHNNGIGTPVNPAKAFELFTAAEKSGHPLAAYKTGCYYGGQFPNFLAVNQEESLSHKLIAAQAGYSIAQHDVSILYRKLENSEQALLWINRAANQGFYLSLIHLSTLYEKGNLVKQDYYQSYKYALLGKREFENEYQEKIPDSYATHIHELAKILGEKADTAEQEARQWKSNPSALTLKARAGLSLALELVRLNQP